MYLWQLVLEVCIEGAVWLQDMVEAERAAKSGKKGKAKKGKKAKKAKKGKDGKGKKKKDPTVCSVTGGLPTQQYAHRTPCSPEQASKVSALVISGNSGQPKACQCRSCNKLVVNASASYVH